MQRVPGRTGAGVLTSTRISSNRGGEPSGCGTGFIRHAPRELSLSSIKSCPQAGQSAGLWTVGPGGVLTLEGAFHHVLSACVRRELFRFMLSKILKSKILDLQFSFEFAMP